MSWNKQVDIFGSWIERSKKTIALIVDINTSSVKIYYQSIRECIVQKGDDPNLFDCILYSCKFLEFQDDESDEEIWAFNAAKLSNTWMSVTSSAKTLVFCDPMLHLFLNEQFTKNVIDMVDSIELELQQKNIKRIATLGIEKKTDKEYFYKLIKKGYELFSFDELFNNAKEDERKLWLIKRLSTVNIQAILLHQRPDVEKLIVNQNELVPILITHRIHSAAVASFYIVNIIS